jgi:predicted P-loop ATPase
MSVDFDRIRREYPLPPVVEASGVKLTADNHEFKAPCPFHGEKTASFTLFQDKASIWRYHCFGCGAHGDVLDYVEERYRCDTAEALKKLTGSDLKNAPSAAEWREKADAYEGYEIGGKPPANAPVLVAGKRTPALLNPKRVDAVSGKPKVTHYTPTMVFPYRTRKGELLGYVLRVEINGKKLTPGIWWTRNKAAKFEGWSHGSFPAPRPLYGLEELEKNPDWQVLLVEGEKCKDAAAAVMAGRRIVPVTWMGGGKSLAKTRWTALRGRSVVIWPDNDYNGEGERTTFGYVEPSGRWHKGLLEHLWDAGVSKIKVVEITREARPDGWDIADAVYQDKLDQRAIELIIRDRLREWTRARFNEWRARKIAETQPQGVNDDGNADDAGSDPDGNRSHGEDDAGAARGGMQEPHSGESEPARASPPATTGRGFNIAEDNWRQHLVMKADGDGLKSTSLQNIALLLQYERRFADIFAWNSFASEVYLMRRPPWDISGTPGHWKPRKMIEPDVTSAACWLEYCGMSPKTNDVGKVIMRVAQHNSFNPVVTRLDELRWDGVPRLSGSEEQDLLPWLSEYMGAADTTENRAFGRRWLIGAAARAFSPGCKNDCMLVLEGPQGIKKSAALRILSDAVTPGVFTDEISDPNSKDAGLQMQGAFLIEIAELDAFRRAEITQIKAWLARQVDRFRRPYGKIIEEFPRSCVFAGTVNPIGLGYLKDPSGGRRFWPVAVDNIDLDRLRKDAAQLWAEAVAAYRDGEQWWLTAEEGIYAKIAQEARYEEDPFGELIDAFVRSRTTVSTMEIMAHMEIPKERRSTIVNRRIATHLHSRGWERVYDGDRIYYQKPSLI